MFKIVHIAKPIAGVGVYIKLLVGHISNEQFENILIGADKPLNFKDKSKKEIQQHSLKINREIRPIADLISLHKLIKLLKLIQPDLIHCHSAKAGILGRIAGYYLNIPTIYTPHAFSYLSGENRLKRYFYKSLEKLFKKLPAKLLACSNSEYAIALSDLHMKRSKLRIWENSISDPHNIQFKTSSVDLSEVYICSIGRPSYQKNIEMLIETFVKLKELAPNLQLVLLGMEEKSNYYQRIKDEIMNANLSNQVVLVPWLERQEMLQILSKSKIYVSTSRYEGLSYSIIEAQALGIPCVCTDVEGNNDLIIDGKNGYLTKLNDVNEMALKISKLLKDHELYENMSYNARGIFLKKYDIEKNIGKLEKIYFSEINK